MTLETQALATKKKTDTDAPEAFQADPAPPEPRRPLGRLEVEDARLLREIAAVAGGLERFAAEEQSKVQLLSLAAEIVRRYSAQVTRSLLTQKQGLDPAQDYEIDENDVIWPVRPAS